MTRKLPRSVRKYLRREKARLRRRLPDSRELDQALNLLQARFFGTSNDTKKD